jgi:hypothetical protein
MEEGETAKRWERTRLQNLVRNAQSGIYYARAFSNGKEIWKSLKTADFSIAETKLAKLLEDQRKVRSLDPERTSAKMSFAQAGLLFATTCIESGIDIPTVSRWLGYKDGGALAMRVYGHLRDDHSRAEAGRVSFEPADAGEDVVPFKLGVG